VASPPSILASRSSRAPGNEEGDKGHDRGADESGSLADALHLLHHFPLLGRNLAELLLHGGSARLHGNGHDLVRRHDSDESDQNGRHQPVSFAVSARQRFEGLSRGVKHAQHTACKADLREVCL
jgi:hypothetical protein